VKFDWKAFLLFLPDLIAKLGKLFEGDSNAQVDAATKKVTETGDASDLNRLTNGVRRSK